MAGVPTATNLQPRITAQTSITDTNPSQTTTPESPTDVATFNLLTDTATTWQPLTGDWIITPQQITHNALIPTDTSLYANQSFSQPMTLTATITHDATFGGGVLFTAPATSTLEGATMARFLDAETLIYGYFTAEGFIAQGTAPVSVRLGIPHELTVTIASGEYQISIDGDTATDLVPLRGVGEGYTGLLTNNASVRFSAITIQSPSQPEQGN